MCGKTCYYNDMKVNTTMRLMYFPKPNEPKDPTNRNFYTWEEAYNEAKENNRIITVQSIYDLGNNYLEILTKMQQAGQSKISIDILDAYDYGFNVDSVSALYAAMAYLYNTEPNRYKKQLQGIERAKAKGVKFGRPPKSLALERAKKYLEMQKKMGDKPSVKEACEFAGISRQTFYKHYGKDE